MKNRELFDKTIGILVNAYFNETLEHGQPCGCAIGNLIAVNNDYQICKSSNGSNWKYMWGARFRSAFWTEVHAYGELGKKPIAFGEDEYNEGIRQLNSTGYDILQTCSIEKAFESPLFKDGEYLEDEEIDPSGYLGLMSVCDALMLIHEATENEVTEAKALFVSE